MPCLPWPGRANLHGRSRDIPLSVHVVLDALRAEGTTGAIRQRVPAMGGERGEISDPHQQTQFEAVTRPPWIDRNAK